MAGNIPRRTRPRVVSSDDEMEVEMSSCSVPPTRKRGRPSKQVPHVDEDDSDDENINLTGRGKQRKLSVTESVLWNSLYPAEDEHVGTVEKINLKNFMCHAQLSFKFSDRVNFIIGRNGTLTYPYLEPYSIMVGLGGRATVTNRGSKISSLIEKGKTSSRIEITLSNRGPDAFRYHDFGPTITVIRVIRANSSVYELRNHNGKTVSTKRDDLSKILEAFNIQVDNPIVILNQETSRNFLQSKSAKDKYSFFMKATQLENTKKNYEKVESDWKLAKTELDRKKMMLPDVENQVKKYEALLTVISNMENQKEKIKRLERELAWWKVDRIEDDVAQEKKELHDIKKQLEKLLSQNADVGVKAEKMQREITEQEDELSTKVREEKELKQTWMASATEITKLKEEFREKEAVTKKISREIAQIQDDRKSMEDEVRKAKSNGNEEFLKEKERRQKAIEATQVKLSELEEHIKTAVDAEKEAKNESAHWHENVTHCSASLSQCEQSIQQVKVQLMNTRAAQKNVVNRFGANTQKILEMIQSERGFKHKPKGPLGNFVNVNDERFIFNVERHCSTLMRAYLCDNTADAKLLKKIFARCGAPESQVYTKKFTQERYDCPFVPSTGKSKCMASYMSFDDADVFNIFIDIADINTISFYESTDAALSDLKSVQTVPKGCKLAYDLQSNRIKPAPGYAYFAFEGQIRVQYLNKSVEDQVPVLEEEMRKLQEEEKKIRLKHLEVKQAYVNSEERVKKAREILRGLRMKSAGYESKIASLRDFEEPEPVNVDQFLQEIEKCNTDIENKEKLLRERKEHLSKFGESLREKMRECKRKESDYKTCSNDVEGLRDKISELQGNLRSIETHRNSVESRKDMLEEKQLAKSQSIADIEKKLADAIADASNVAPERVKTSSRRTESQISNEIRVLSEQLKRLLNTQPDPERTKASYLEIKTRYDGLVAQIEKIETYIQTMGDLVRLRRKTYEKVRDLLAFRINLIFKSLLLNERFMGELRFDHNAKTLDMDVYPAGQAAQSSNRDVRGLSGGERSFSTVCFVLSLWETTEMMPFRIMDEFDIFMDMSKRRVSMQLLLQVCDKFVNSQFIFLTPLEMPNISQLDSDSVKIQMMPEPRRR